VRKVIFSPPEPVKSQFNTSYATVLNLYEKYQDKLFQIYPRSLHYFQSKPNQREVALKSFEAKLRLLREEQYIVDNQLTAKGQFAKKVYGYELILSELNEEKILEQLDEFGLGVIACAVVFEPRKNQRPPLGLSRNLRRLKTTCEEIYAHMQEKEARYRIFPFSKLPYFHLSGAIEAWLRGTTFEKTLQCTDTDEGELVRYFRMSIQVLREISDATGASSVLKQRIKEAIRVINRDVVDAEKQLREG